MEVLEEWTNYLIKVYNLSEQTLLLQKQILGWVVHLTLTTCLQNPLSGLGTPKTVSFEEENGEKITLYEVEENTLSPTQYTLSQVDKNNGRNHELI